jgi:hypothetical protein
MRLKDQASPATEAQQAFIRSLCEDIDQQAPEDGLTKAQAAKVINSLKKQREASWKSHR